MRALARAITLGRHGVANIAAGRPLCVSFEITHNCNARCRHCHRGGEVDTFRASPARFGEISRDLRPPSVQISGGEPLLRKDVEDIVRAVRMPDGTPYIIFVTNAALLTPERYSRLIEAGVDVFSVSLDYPDERHDGFRNIPGLFRHIEDLVARAGNGSSPAITLNTVVQRDNFRELPRMAELARDWGIEINFSPYTWLRTNDRSYLIPPDELPAFGEIVQWLIEFKRVHGTVRTTDSFFNHMSEFFRTGSIPGCRAGERFLVVNPDGTLSPCGLVMTSYPNQAALIGGFTRTNTCTHCHTCIRSSTETPFNNLLRGALRTLFA